MAMPPSYPGGLAGPDLQISGPGEHRSNVGQIFTLAVLAAGRGGCDCKSCQLLKRVVDEMEAALEPRPNARPG